MTNRWAFWLLQVAVVMQGCSLNYFAYKNEGKPAGKAPPARTLTAETVWRSAVYSETVPWQVPPRCRNLLASASAHDKCVSETPADEDFIAIAISGGGSRSAVFSAQVLFELQRYGALAQVDAISSVSGGSYTAAWYALSRDPGVAAPETPSREPRPEWREPPVFRHLEANFSGKWIRAWFNPYNIGRYWFTKFDRSDIMANVLDDVLFDDMVFEDLNPQRPTILINSTNNTHLPGVNDRRSALNFVFSRETFDALHSDIARFPLSQAVVASSAFPAAFQRVTLRDFSSGKPQYVHVFDGGSSDNLGLSALERVLLQLRGLSPDRLPKRVTVFLVDAFVPPIGPDSRLSDPRTSTDYILDSTVMDAFDTLMQKLREDRISSFQSTVHDVTGRNAELFHITWSPVGKVENAPAGHLKRAMGTQRYEALTSIGTKLSIEPYEAACLREAARYLVNRHLAMRTADQPRFEKPSPSTAFNAECTAPPEPPKMEQIGA